jgi:predicted ArsR family transcriptional regulator
VKSSGSACVASATEQSTRARVRELLLHCGALTASALATDLGLSPAAVRRHLDALEVEGVVSSRDVRSYGKRLRGRPAREYVLTASGHAEGPQSYDTLATQALDFLAEHGGPKAVADFARSRAEALAGRYAQARTPDALASALTADGYAAAVESSPAGTVICQHHCPVEHTAAAHPELCEAETVMLAEVLGHHVVRLATIARGDGVCTTLIPSLSRQPPPPEENR